MTVQHDAPMPTLSHYQTRLTSFEGPLDVLLRLIERHQLEITDVSLVQVMDQFLEFTGHLTDAHPEVIAEFTMVGTRLALLKSRSLLPRPRLVDQDEEADAGDLVHQLQGYKRLKEVAHRLAERRESGYVSFAAPGTAPSVLPGYMEPPKLAQYEPSVLIQSIRRRLSVIPPGARTIHRPRVISIRPMIERIIRHTSRTPSFRFSAITEDLRTRSEFATAFLAVLLMIRRRSLEASQAGLFREIHLTAASGTDDKTGTLDGIENEFVN